MSQEYVWPKPWLLALYEQAVAEGCIRIVLRGTTAEERFTEWKSFKAAFYRLRRKKDASFAVQMQPAFQMVSLRYEAELGKVLISYSSLPDGNTLPTVEAVDQQRRLPQPTGSIASATLEESPDDFNPTEHVRGLIDKIALDDEEPASEL